MNGAENERPESLPQQVQRLVAAGYRSAQTLPAYWGLITWVAICLGLQLVASGLQRFLITGGASSLLPYYAWSLLTLPTSSISGTLLPLCGLGAALGGGRVAWRVAVSLAILLAPVALYSFDIVLILAFDHLMAWVVWFGIGLCFRQLTQSVFGASEPTGLAPSSRWTLRDLLLMTTVAALLCALAGWIVRGFSYADQLGGNHQLGGMDVANISWGMWLLLFGIGLLRVAAFIPVVAGLFPIVPGTVSLGRLLRYGGVSFGIYLFINLGLLLISDSQISLLSEPTWWLYGWQLLWNAVFPSLGSVLGFVAAGLWLRWWGYRRWRLPQPSDGGGSPDRPVGPVSAAEPATT